MITDESWMTKLKDLDVEKINIDEKGTFAHLLFRYAYKRSPKLKIEFYTKKPGKKYTEGIDVAHQNEVDVVMNLILDNPDMDVESFKKEALRIFTSKGWPTPESENELNMKENLEPWHPGLSYEPNQLDGKLVDAIEEVAKERAKHLGKPRESHKPLIDLTYDPSRRPFLIMLAIGIFIVLAIVFVIFDMLKS